MGTGHVPELSVDLAALQALFDKAKALTDHNEFVVIGSLSILGLVKDATAIPPRMLMSIDVDCYTPRDPGRIFDLQESLGEASEFRARHGYYLDPVSPALLTVPDGWEARLVSVDLDGGIVVRFLDANDAAVSKYARNDPRDREWIRAGLSAGVIGAQIVAARFARTDFASDGERSAAYAALEEDRSKTAK
jgi:hypothetical protein